MSTVLSDRVCRAAKPYRCWYCNQRIERGEAYGYRTGVTEGDFWAMRFHPECDAHAVEHWDADDWECAEPGSYERPMTAFDPSI